MGVPSTELQFATQPHGKPMLMRPSPHSLQFNVSHTSGMALLAVTLQHAVGIDVEWTDRKVQDRDIAQRYFSARESAYLASQAPSERTSKFFSFWTCKEAYLKMQGKGIGEGLAHCELSVEPDQPEVRLALLDQPELKEEYSLYQIRAGAEHVGAVALACPSAQISYWNWQDEYLD
jgi:4'-phosphopantetheinyl transferase